jgi:hypothetical protein
MLPREFVTHRQQNKLTSIHTTADHWSDHAYTLFDCQCYTAQDTIGHTSYEQDGVRNNSSLCHLFAGRSANLKLGDEGDFCSEEHIENPHDIPEKEQPQCAPIAEHSLPSSKVADVPLQEICAPELPVHARAVASSERTLLPHVLMLHGYSQGWVILTMHATCRSA